MTTAGSSRALSLPPIRANVVQYLHNQGVLDGRQKDQLLRKAGKDGISLLLLQEQTNLPLKDLYGYISHFSQIPIDPEAIRQVPGHVLKALPASVCKKYSIYPVALTPKSVTVATAVPLTEWTVRKLEPYVNRRKVNQVLVDFPTLFAALDDLAKGGGAGRPKGFNRGAVNTAAAKLRDYTTTAVEAAELPDIVEEVIVLAMQAGASDLHFEPRERLVVVRMRIDGLLQEIARFPRELHEPIISRLKVLSQADITEKYIPQDGRFTIKAKNLQIDIRSSFFRTVNGEKAALRMVDANHKHTSISSLGFEEEHMAVVHRVIQRPYGMVLVTGPTGSGKTTTIFSFLEHLNRPDLNLTTIEDPNEYQIAGINQCSLNKARGLNFDLALRAILRQDPDIIMLGEIRDQETAEIAFHAALTGHLVFATLHTNDSLSTIGRIINLGIDKAIVALGLNGIISQRLVRCVCPTCMEVYVPDEGTIQSFGLNDFDGITLARGRGCADCQGRGVRGRTGLFEILEINESIQDIIQLGATAQELHAVAKQSNWSSLRFAGVRKLLSHVTTVEEVLAATVTQR